MAVRLYLTFLILTVIISSRGSSQTINDSISKESIEKTITYLASDKLGGRVNYTKEQLEAAEFISNQFTSYGLEPFPGFQTFYQPFRTSLSDGVGFANVKWNGNKLHDSLVYFFSHSLNLSSLSVDDFFILQVFPPVADSILYRNWSRAENILIQVILPDSISFSEAVKNIKVPEGTPASNILLTRRSDEPVTLSITPNQKLINTVLYNVIGMIPGRSHPDEAVIFSAHYDHVNMDLYGGGVGVFNGANDDASGTTAVIELAKYFSMRRNNERTIIFCLFAGEELGLLGSQAFINYIKPETIKAVINIEMIGMHNATGKNAFMLTGSNYSDLFKILNKNLEGDEVEVQEQGSDPDNLFGRSDNYTFAQEGIPAHTVMCSDDKEPCYHKPCDDVRRIDMDNMTRIIRAIAKSAETLISGKDTPSRIK